LSQAGGPPHTVLVTSATRGEGKTTTLVNTAIVFAQLGIRVLIIDGDLRRPHCHRLLRMENSAGLSDLLAGQIEPESAIRPTSAENLFFISAGALPPNPAELLGSNKMHDLLEELRGQFEFIFVDSSPLLAVSDAVFLSTMVEGTLLVVNRRTPKPLVRKARARLTVSQTKILGMLLNRIDVHNNEYGGYYQQYHEYYAEDPARLPDSSRSVSENGNGASRHDSGLNGSASRSLDPVINGKSGNGHSAGVVGGVRSKLAAAVGPIADRVLREPVGPQPVTQEIENLAEASADTAHEPAKARSQTAAKQIDGKAPLRASEKPAASSSSAGIQKRHDRLPPELLHFVREKLSEAMGPMASLVLNDHIRVLGESPESFPTARLDELVKRVSKEIFTGSFRQQFEEQVKKEIARIDQRYV
jgi:capsular exopolysaccharide synthesis family protein